MAFDGLLHWLEKNPRGKHAAAAGDDPPAEQPEVTSEGGMTLPPISGGASDD